MKKFFSIAVAATVLLAASGSHAETKAERATLPDNSVHVTVTSKKGGGIAPSQGGMAMYHCNPTCTFVAGNTNSGPSALGTVAGPASFVAGMRVLRPAKGDSTYVSNDSSSRSNAEGGSARSDAYVDQSYREDNSTRFDFWGNDGPIGIFPPAPPPPAPDIKG